MLPELKQGKIIEALNLLTEILARMVDSEIESTSQEDTTKDKLLLLSEKTIPQHIKLLGYVQESSIDRKQDKVALIQWDLAQSLLKGLDERRAKEEFEKVLAYLQEKRGIYNDVVNTEMNELDCEWYTKSERKRSNR